MQIQSYAPKAIIVVDDGSTDNTKSIMEKYSCARYVYQSNQGLSAARNKGLSIVDSKYVVFLDSDDKLLPNALQSQYICAKNNPNAAFVSGRYQRMDLYGYVDPKPTDPNYATSYVELLAGNHIGMHATVLFQVNQLRKVGGYDTSLKCCEDYDVYLKLARIHEINTFPDIVALYRIYNGSMSSDTDKMLDTAINVLHRQYQFVVGDKILHSAYCQGRKYWLRCYGRNRVIKVLRNALALNFKKSLSTYKQLNEIDSTTTYIMVFNVIWESAIRKVKNMVRKLVNPIRHYFLRKRLGDLRRTSPFSRHFGFELGLPVDRYYIEQFLELVSHHISGKVLEIGDSTYTNRFGDESRVTHSEVLHLSDEGANYTGSLTNQETLPADTFDCVILTQTLHLLYEHENAIANLYRSLKPGGVIIVTVPGISQICSDEWADTWSWSFTMYSLRRCLESKFNNLIEVKCYGNVLAATGFLYGLPASEFSKNELAVHDEKYQLVICACYSK